MPARRERSIELQSSEMAFRCIGARRCNKISEFQAAKRYHILFSAQSLRVNPG